MEIGVIVPVIRPNLLQKLLQDIKKQTTLPKQIIIVNNTAHQISVKEIPFVQTSILKPYKPMGVNEAWKYGFNNLHTEAFAVLNDDVRICSNFFDFSLKIFRKYRKIVVISPNLSENLKTVYSEKDQPVLEVLKKREGWAYVIRKSFIESVPPIPDELKIYYGDDWYWYWADRTENEWAKIENAYCVHVPHNGKEGSRRLKQIRLSERYIFYDIIKEINKNEEI